MVFIKCRYFKQIGFDASFLRSPNFSAIFSFDQAAVRADDPAYFQVFSGESDRIEMLFEACFYWRPIFSAVAARNDRAS